MSGHGVGYGTPSPTTQPIPVLGQSGFGAGQLQTQQAGPSGASPAPVGVALPGTTSQTQANQAAATPSMLPAALAPTGAAPAAPTTGITAGPQYSPTNPPPGYTYAGMSTDTWTPPTPETGAPGSSSAPTSLDPGVQAEYYNTAQYQAAQTAYNTQLAAYNQEYAQAQATYNAQIASYQKALATYNAQVAQRASWQSQLNQMLATGLPGLQAAENELRQQLGQPIQPMTAQVPSYNPYSNVGENGQPIPQGVTPEQAYYASRPAPVAPSNLYTANSTGGGTVYVAPSAPIVGNPTGASAAALDASSGVGGVGTQLFGTGNTAGSLNASYQAQLAAAGGASANFAGISDPGLGAAGGDQGIPGVPFSAAPQEPTVDIGTPFETAPVPFTSDGTGPGQLPYTIDSGIPQPGYTAPTAEQLDAQANSQVYAPPPPTEFAPSMGEQFNSAYDFSGFENAFPSPVAPFTPAPAFYGAPVDESGFTQTGTGGVDEAGFNYVAPPALDGLSLAQQQGFTTAGPGSGPGPAQSPADIAASKLQGAQTLGQALSALGTTPSQLSQLGMIANTDAPIDLSQPLGPQLQADVPGFVYGMITDALAKYGVGTIDQLQQAVTSAQPNITPQGSDFSGQIAPQMTGYESPVGTFSTGVPPDYGAAPIPQVDIPQPEVISGFGGGGPMAGTGDLPPDQTAEQAAFAKIYAPFLAQLQANPDLISMIQGFPNIEIGSQAGGKLNPVNLQAFFTSALNRGAGLGMSLQDIFSDVAGHGAFWPGAGTSGPGTPNPSVSTTLNPQTGVSSSYYPSNLSQNAQTSIAEALYSVLQGNPYGVGGGPGVNALATFINNNGAGMPATAIPGSVIPANVAGERYLVDNLYRIGNIIQQVNAAKTAPPMLGPVAPR